MGAHIVDGAVRIRHAVLQVILLDGVAQAVRIGAAVAVDCEQVELRLVLQQAGVAVFLQERIEEQQVKLGVIGREHRAGRQERGQQLGKGLLADPLFAQQLVRDARQLHDARRQAARAADELIDLLRAGGGQADGGKFNDLHRAASSGRSFPCRKRGRSRSARTAIAGNQT